MFVVKKYFRESWQLTQSNLGAFIGATAIMVVGSVLTLFLMLPVLMSGLEGMYLRAWQGKTISARDVFMHRRKLFPLLGTTFLIILDIVLSLLVFIVLTFLLISVLFVLLNVFAAKVSELSSFVKLVLLLIVPLWVLGVTVLICYREGLYLHALNFVSECDLGVFDSLRQSKIATKNRWSAAFLAFLYLVVSGMFFSSLHELPFLFIALFLFPLVVGATAMAFALDVGF